MKKILFSLTLFFISASVSAQVITQQSFLEDIAGVYKVRFQNAFVTGEKYTSENILEIVPVNDHAAYFRMKLAFYNGHEGDIFGVAKQDRSKLVYFSKENNCLLELNFSQHKMSTHADYNQYPGCSYYHGARGTLDNLEFPRTNKRPIRYMARLKNSAEFKSAIEEYKKSEIK